jgi:hypothetical protein
MVLHLDGSYLTRSLVADGVSDFGFGPELNETFAGETPVVFHTLLREGFGYKDGVIMPSGRFLLLQALPNGTRATVTKALPSEITEAVKGEKAFTPETRVPDLAPAPSVHIPRGMAMILSSED